MLHPLGLFFSLNRFLARLEASLMVLTLLVMLGFASLQVILRNFFDTGIEWGDVFARHLVLWLGFFGATLSTMEERHIRMDVLLKVIPQKAHVLIQVFVSCFCIVVCFLLYQAALRFVMDEKMAQTVLFRGIPTWYFIVIMPVGFGIITFRHVLELITILLKFGGKNPDKYSKPSFKSDPSALDISVRIQLK